MENRKFTNNDIRKAIHRSQHTQRNWDLDTPVSKEDLDTIVEAATQCPSKQGRPFYKTHVITNRELIEKIHAETEGSGLVFTEDGVKAQTNPQTLANVVLVFERNNETKSHSKHPAYEKHEDVTQRDTDVAIGIAAGYVNIVSSMLGYRTGCCQCFDPAKMSETIGIEGDTLLIMGVGNAQEGVNRRIHHKDGTYVFNSKRKEEMPVSYVA